MMAYGMYRSDTSTNTLWTPWTDGSSTSDTYPTTWYNWNDSTSTSTQYHYVRYSAARPAVSEKTRQQQQRAYAKARDAEKAAKEAAEKLLFEHLTEEQRDLYRKAQKFHVVSSEGKRYEVDTKRRWHNIFELNEDGKRVKEFCIYQTGETPIADNHLAQKLLLECDEAMFKKIANAKTLAVG